MGINRIAAEDQMRLLISELDSAGNAKDALLDAVWMRRTFADMIFQQVKQRMKDARALGYDDDEIAFWTGYAINTIRVWTNRNGRKSDRIPRGRPLTPPPPVGEGLDFEREFPLTR